MVKINNGKIAKKVGFQDFTITIQYLRLHQYRVLNIDKFLNLGEKKDVFSWTCGTLPRRVCLIINSWTQTALPLFFGGVQVTIFVIQRFNFT